MTHLDYHRPKRPSAITIPDERCHPLARLVFHEMRQRNATYEQLEWDAGVLVSTFKSWRPGHSQPGLITIEATLGALKWVMTPVQIQPLPLEIAEAIEAFCALWLNEEPLLHQIMASAVLAPVTPGGVKPRRRYQKIEARR